MHGRVKKEKPPTNDEIENDRKKSAMYNKLLNIVFSCRQKHEMNEPVLDLTTKILKLNPDVYTVWNFRREIILRLHSGSVGVSADVPAERIPFSRAKDIVAAELNLSTEAIKKNSKSYGAWYHRKWILDRFDVNISAEFALCKEFLTFDQRNFHCWNYRRYLVSKAKVSHSAEFDFSADKISENFSNYSAFHHRSVYITSMMSCATSSCEKKALLVEEFSIIENAIFTEPDDQSAWWYYHFLLRYAGQVMDLNSYGDWFRCELHRQLGILNNLLEVEQSSKWCMLAKIFLIAELLKVSQQGDEILCEERVRMVEALIALDPSHVARYRYLLHQFNR